MGVSAEAAVDVGGGVGREHDDSVTTAIAMKTLIISPIGERNARPIVRRGVGAVF
jgi:hypothetical protein